MNTVLHIDDDPDHRLIVSMLADSWGSRVALVQAKSAAEGELRLADFLQRGERILILCDHMMPGERGAPFLVRNLARCRAARVPLWLLTSFPDDPEVQAAVEAGVDGAIDKPLDLDAFEEALSKIVGPWLIRAPGK